MQEELQWASELPGDGQPYCVATRGEPWKGTATETLAQECFWLMTCVLTFIIAAVLIFQTWRDWAKKDFLSISVISESWV